MSSSLCLTISIAEQAANKDHGSMPHHIEVLEEVLEEEHEGGHQFEQPLLLLIPLTTGYAEHLSLGG